MKKNIEIVDPRIHEYIDRLLVRDNSVLKEMESLARETHFPIIGEQVGRLLFILTRTLQAQRIFEMGSGFGYSAYWFACALPDSGKVFQTDRQPQNAEKARAFFQKAGLLSKTEFLIGDALELIETTPGPFDIVLLDLEKQDYPAALKKAKAKLKRGGLLIADNALWSGAVLDETSKDLETIGIQEFTKELFHDPDFFATLLPVRDGVAIALKQN